MSEKENEQHDEAAEHEVKPDEGPGPRGNQDVDEERLSRDLEDLERAGAN